jgi:hypothetical protein
MIQRYRIHYDTMADCHCSTEHCDEGRFVRYSEYKKLHDSVSQLLQGCGNHSCQVNKPIGMGTNGPCNCARHLREKLEHIVDG